MERYIPSGPTWPRDYEIKRQLFAVERVFLDEIVVRVYIKGWFKFNGGKKQFNIDFCIKREWNAEDVERAIRSHIGARIKNYIEQQGRKEIRELEKQEKRSKVQLIIDELQHLKGTKKEVIEIELEDENE